MDGIPGLGDGPAGPQLDGPDERAAPRGSAPSVLPPRRPEEGPSSFLVVKTATCGWCQRTLDFLTALHEERGDFQVAVLDANEEPEAYQKVAATTRRTAVPQVFLDGGFVGGWDDLARAAKSGRLDAYLDGEDWAEPPASPAPRGVLSRLRRRATR